jgi:hypothetical protein
MTGRCFGREASVSPFSEYQTVGSCKRHPGIFPPNKDENLKKTSTPFQVAQTIEQQSVYYIIHRDLEASHTSLSKFGDEFLHVKLHWFTLDHEL